MSNIIGLMRSILPALLPMLLVSLPVFGTAPPPVAAGFAAQVAPANIYPADAAGAVSASYLVAVSNGGVVVQDRAGKTLSSVRLGQFWTDPVVPSGTGVYHPRIVYDAAADRWILTTLSDRDLEQGALLVAISDSGNPAGTWKRYLSPIDAAGQRIGDLPRIAQNADSVIVAINEWIGDSFPAGTSIFVIPKTYSGAPAIQRLHFTSTFDFAPVTTSGSERQLVNVEGTRAVTRDIVGSSLPNPKAYQTTVNFTHGFNTLLGPQLGSGLLVDTGDTMAQAAASRNGVIWMAHMVLLTSSRSGILVWQISGASAKTYLIEDPEKVFAFPSIAVNRYGAALVSYQVFSSVSYPAAGYSYIDPKGVLSSPGILKTGTTPYLIGRWGDYTTTLVDPADDTSFWAIHMVPTQTNAWTTWWSYIPVPGISGRSRAARH